MNKRKHISFFPNEREARDFEEVRRKMERHSNSDTVRAMLRFCKKNLSKITDISVSELR